MKIFQSRQGRRILLRPFRLEALSYKPIVGGEKRTSHEHTHPEIDARKQRAIELARWLIDKPQPLSDIVRRLEDIQAAAFVRGTEYERAMRHTRHIRAEEDCEANE